VGSTCPNKRHRLIAHLLGQGAVFLENIDKLASALSE
jgi:hypothetical protein